MPNVQCWMLSTFSYSHTLTLTHTHTFSHTHKKNHAEPFPIRTGSSSLLRRKRQDWTVPHPNSKLCIGASKETTQNRLPCQHRTLHCYSEKDKTEPFSIPTENAALLDRKRQEEPFSPSEERSLHCYIEKGKTEPFPIRTRNSSLLHTLLHTLKRQDWIVLNVNIDLFTGNPKQYAHHNNRAPIHFTLKCKWMHSPDKTQDSCTQSPQRIKDLPSFTEKNDGHTKKDMFHHKKERQPNPSALP